MKISDIYLKAIDNCLERNIPFVLFSLPSVTDCQFHASLCGQNKESHAFSEDNNSDTFFINFYANDEPYTAGVPFQFDAQGILDYIENNKNTLFDDAEIRPSVASTYRVSYDAAINSVKPRLKQTGGKVVISQHQTIVSKRNLHEVITDLFSWNQYSFRYICFTPETGIWMGATPELLLQSRRDANEYMTYSLAGTMPIDDEAPWNEKNIKEQKYVTDFILDEFHQMNIPTECSETGELHYGNIKHLCSLITAKGNIDVVETLNRLSPTPAVSGIPRDIAIAEIDAFETHCRRCYSGYVGVRLNGLYYAYVNIRCAFLAKVMVEKQEAYIYNLYSGGGILASSDCESEWQEAQSKISALKEIIEKDNSVIDANHRNNAIEFHSNYDSFLPF